MNATMGARPGTRSPGRWSAADWEPRAAPARMAPLLVVTGANLLWWAVSFILGPLWLALGRRTHETLDDFWSLGDGR